MLGCRRPAPWFMVKGLRVPTVISLSRLRYSRRSGRYHFFVASRRATGIQSETGRVRRTGKKKWNSEHKIRIHECKEMPSEIERERERKIERETYNSTYNYP